MNRRDKCFRVVKGFGGLSSRCVKDAIADMLARDGLDAFTNEACETIAQKIAKENRKIWSFGAGNKS
jgi:hypothetical protein